ncbi:MAG: hypothetical protein MZV70_52725 [Desulfobacterales bacterium]|nr:hypothetical protein [Desulfobacterales bacterium]
MSGAVLLAGAGLLALPLGQLERVQSLGLFQPAVAGFASWRGLTQSPADIFLTALTGFGLAGLPGRLRLPVLARARRRGCPSRPASSFTSRRPLSPPGPSSPCTRSSGGSSSIPTSRSSAGTSTSRAWSCSSASSSSSSPGSSSWRSRSDWPSGARAQDPGRTDRRPRGRRRDMVRRKGPPPSSRRSARPWSHGFSPSPSSPACRGGGRSGSPASSWPRCGWPARSTA